MDIDRPQSDLDSDLEAESESDWLDDSKQGGAQDPLVEAEWTRLATKYSDAGYREGITDGKLSTLQLGFDEGFSNSVPSSRRLGKLRGRANGLLSWYLNNGQSSISFNTSSSTKSSSSLPSPSIRPQSRSISPSKPMMINSSETMPMDFQSQIEIHTHDHEQHDSKTNNNDDDMVEKIRDLVKDLARVKRDQILPFDHERHEHEKDEHHGKSGQDYMLFELGRTDQREMESLEDMLEGINGKAEPWKSASGALREDALLDNLQNRLEELENRTTFGRLGLRK